MYGTTDCAKIDCTEYIKVYGGWKLCEGKIKEEDLLVINFIELMVFRENDFTSLNKENVLAEFPNEIDFYVDFYCI